jgi:hypothetical protein
MSYTKSRAFLVTAVAVGILFGSVRFFGRDGCSETNDVDPSNHAESPKASTAESASPGTPGLDAIGNRGLTLVSGATLAIASDSLPVGGAVALNLEVSEPSAIREPFTGRILSEGRAPLALSAASLAADRRAASVEIDADWLSPGRYIVEVHTTERTHFPLRRYAFEIQ